MEPAIREASTLFQVSRRRFAGLIATVALLSPGASAQPGAFPNRPVRIVVPFPPGQASDTFARLLAERLSARWPQPVVVENRPGAGGAIAVEAVIRSAPDGYTLLWGGTGITVLPAVVPRLNYDVARDLAAIARVADIPMVLIAGAEGRIRTIADLVATARARPGELVYGSGGPGSLQHLTGELLANRAGIRLSHVPYRGSGPAMTDLVSGTIPLMVDSSASALPQIRGGRAIALGVASERRSPLMPDVPTVAEAGVADVVAMGWNGLYAPAAVPAPILDAVHDEANRIIADPAVAARFAELGAEPTPSSRQAFQDFTLAELAKWRQVAQLAGLKLD
jgi:tripartite-type tricarboxylate transporter receptor subunit TctC